jgi:hypothetical protein
MSFGPSNPVVLPFTPSVAYYTFSTTLADRIYIFDVHWNARDLAWYFDLLDSNSNVIASGVKVVLGAVLARWGVNDPLIQQGSLVAKDTSKQDREAGFDDLGTRVQVRYYTIYDILAVVRSARGQ